MIAAYELGGTGPQVLLLHGGGGTADHWQEFAAQLDGFRVVAIDLPGHGASSDSSWQWDDVLDELETLGLTIRPWSGIRSAACSQSAGVCGTRTAQVW